MVKVISIKPEYERILAFLYPNYAICPEGVVYSEKFITHRNIASKTERESLEVRHKDCIFISTRIFDEIWDEDKIEKEALEFSRIYLKNRKRTTGVERDSDFIDNLLKFMFYQDSLDAQNEKIYELFDNFGSKNFNRIFLELSETMPVQVLTASMNTFIYKITQENNPSLYYKKKALLYKEKISKNFLKAYDEYCMRDNDPFGLSYIKYFNDLIINE